MLLIVTAVAATPALAEPTSPSEIKAAELRVHVQRRALARAIASNDAATIATARASFEAAQAVAWSKRHPAKAPVSR